MVPKAKDVVRDAPLVVAAAPIDPHQAASRRLQNSYPIPPRSRLRDLGKFKNFHRCSSNA
jgi:hypothetical protein